jgi:thiosulfate/3-mercaptopyruvate sulfurtransferase
MILYEYNKLCTPRSISRHTVGRRNSFLVLKCLLGYPDVKNYDGSWAEWGNMIANPIEK